MNYDHCMDGGGFTWYCQVPGSLWVMDPVLGWEIFFDTERRPASWILTGHGVEYDTGAGRSSFKAALREAGRWIKEDNV
jgi:hypothetical protein